MGSILYESPFINKGDEGIDCGCEFTEREREREREVGERTMGGIKANYTQIKS